LLELELEEGPVPVSLHGPAAEAEMSSPSAQESHDVVTLRAFGRVLPRFERLRGRAVEGGGPLLWIPLSGEFDDDEDRCWSAFQGAGSTTSGSGYTTVPRSLGPLFEALAVNYALLGLEEAVEALEGGDVHQHHQTGDKPHHHDPSRNQRPAAGGGRQPHSSCQRRRAGGWPMEEEVHFCSISGSVGSLKMSWLRDLDTCVGRNLDTRNHPAEEEEEEEHTGWRRQSGDGWGYEWWRSHDDRRAQSSQGWWGTTGSSRSQAAAENSSGNQGEGWGARKAAAATQEGESSWGQHSSSSSHAEESGGGTALGGGQEQESSSWQWKWDRWRR
jgi:hypothetical protein